MRFEVNRKAASFALYFSDMQSMGAHTKYPFVLVHGVGWRDTGRLRYWGRIPERLRESGALVFLAGNDGFASIEDCAAQLEARIDEVRDSTGATKVNIIAHSMGGLDARYYISSLGHGDLVASLTTFNTPHRGSAVADFLLEDLGLINRRVAGLIDLFSRNALGEESPDAYLASRELRPEACALFNEENPDDDRVYYRSYASVIDNRFLKPPYAVTGRLLYKREGENDGLVSVASARWGDFRGIVGADRGLSISHDGIHDLKLFPTLRRFDAPAFFVSVTAELAQEGF
jgi:triacylglycerol lipase